MKGRKIPNLLVFKPTFKPEPIKKLEAIKDINSDEEEIYDDPNFDPNYVYTEDEEDQDAQEQGEKVVFISSEIHFH